MAEKDRKESILFCPRCFASGDDSSWGDPVVDGHCFNCGAGGSSISIPRWAVESIREQASWVGKRYYPHEEDRERAEETALLRAIAPDDPRRKVTVDPDNPRRYRVEQPTKRGWTSTGVTASSLEEAREKAKLVLPYMAPEEGE
jgi:hypothetical protein